jgi:hypothetical protein
MKEKKAGAKPNGEEAAHYPTGSRTQQKLSSLGKRRFRR